jgi:putative sigma-54 modulation protein
LQITITGKHIEVTDAIRDHVNSKVSKLPRYYSNISQIDVIVDGTSTVMPAIEIIARGEHNKVFVARESDADLYAAIDLASHKLERQLTKTKTKERDNKYPGSERERPQSEPEDE